jgi:hypothetical protein
LPDVEGKVDMAARRQLANKLRTPYGKASKAGKGSKADKNKILDRAVGHHRVEHRRAASGVSISRIRLYFSRQ